ncbi:hypothetical protein B0T18DRAFT_391691 [Schizothecium vesticola]|uniref:SnoaL-like domain-containing protein n=1 Tax=Schizothecium vesticola TaxID=314040 RepID=A0AA40K1V4_9PEZI|nr:hypothetical protein B0T18DRAFT_391691 [Schizothecium vesticola]
MAAALFSKTSLAAAIIKLYTCPDEIYLDYLDTLFASNIKAIVNDEALHFDDVNDKVKELRAGPKLSFPVLDLLRDGKNFAWRHVGKSTLLEGKKKGVQTFVFEELDDEGRVMRQNERVVIFESWFGDQQNTGW